MRFFLFYLIAVIFLLKPSSVMAESIFAGDIKEAVKKDNIVEFKCSEGLLNIYVLKSNIIRFRYVREKFSERPSYGVIWNNTEKAEFSFMEKEDSYELSTDEMKVIIRKIPAE